MKRMMAAGFLLVLAGGECVAQEVPENRGAGYVFVAPGAAVAWGESAGLLHFGVGGQGLLYRGLGMSGEVGYLAPTAGMQYGVGLASINGFYQFGRAGHGRKAVPFVTGGYSLAFRQGVANAINFGGGLNYWFGSRKALLLEVRDYLSPQEGDIHMLTCRIGLSFR